MITETERQAEISDSCDVLVCGDGVAGISAAPTAACEDADILLIEREWIGRSCNNLSAVV